MPEKTPPPTPAQEADAADGGWTVESASVGGALAPADTTETAIAESAATEKPAVAEVPDPDAAASDGTLSESAGTDSLASQAAAKAAEKPVKGAKPVAQKPGDVARREASLTKQINELTFQKKTTLSEIEQAQAKLTALKAELAESEAKKTGPAPVVAKPATAAAAPTEMPAHPKYPDFETDAEYEAAVGKWRTDVATWQTAREQALKDDITKGLDARFQSREQEEAARVAETRVAASIDKARAAHEDWDTAIPSLKELRSPWATDAKLPTPFLSDVVATVEDGGEILYYLATHPDEAQALADLRPTKALRDAIVESSSPRALLEHFATAEGQQAFEHLKTMHPVRLFQAVGALTVQVAADTRGPAATPAAQPITQAVPSAKPPAGSPRARTDTASSGDPTKQPFEEWMAEEDRKDLAARYKALGLPVPA